MKAHRSHPSVAPMLGSRDEGYSPGRSFEIGGHEVATMRRLQFIENLKKQLAERK
jgi:hypothetical protein